MLNQVEGKMTHQGVDVPYPKRAKGGLSIKVASKPPFGGFGYRTLVQSRKSKHIQPFAFPLLRDIVRICFQREVLLGLPKINQPQPIHHNEVGRDIWRESKVYMRDLELRDQRERQTIEWILRTRTISRVSFHAYDFTAPERAFEAATNRPSYSVGGL